MSSAISPGESGPTLAELIYVELVGRAFLRAENAASIKPEPAVLAKLSIELASAFREAQKQAADELTSKKNLGYDVRGMDLGSLR